MNVLPPERRDAMLRLPMPEVMELPQDEYQAWKEDFKDLEPSPEKLNQYGREKAEKEKSEIIHIQCDAISAYIDSEDEEDFDTFHIHCDAISAYIDDDDDLEQPSQTILSRSDIMEHHFKTLTPFIEDYIKTEYELEEEPALHIPQLKEPGSSRYGPLSYQRTVLEEDPILSEDFDNGRHPTTKGNSEYLHSFNKTTRIPTESLYCSGTSQYESETEDLDDFPSSLAPSAYEYQLQQEAKLQEKEQQKMKKEEEEKPTSKYTPYIQYIPPFVINSINKIKDMIDKRLNKDDDLNDWFECDDDDLNDFFQQDFEPDFLTVLQNNLPENYLLNIIMTIFIATVIGLGSLVHYPVLLFSACFALFNFLGKQFIETITSIMKTAYSYYFNNKKQRRKLFSNNPGTSGRRIHDHLFKNQEIINKINVDTIQGYRIDKPDGSVSRSHKIKRTISIEPAKPSEARIVKVVDDRAFFITNIFNKFKAMALYDPGSCCCIIKPSFLEKIREEEYVLTEQSQHVIEGFVKNSTKGIQEMVYLDFTLETGHLIQNVPFLVCDSKYDILIGNNLVRSHRRANCWKNSNYYIDVGFNQPLVPTYSEKKYKEDRRTTAVSVSEITINKRTAD